MMSGLDLDDIYAFAKALGRDAGNLLQDAANRRIRGELTSSSTEKDSSVDIVTQVCIPGQYAPESATDICIVDR